MSPGARGRRERTPPRQKPFCGSALASRPSPYPRTIGVNHDALTSLRPDQYHLHGQPRPSVHGLQCFDDAAARLLCYGWVDQSGVMTLIRSR